MSTKGLAGKPWTRTWPPKDCAICDESFTPGHPSARYCRDCRPTPLWRQCERDGWICHICSCTIAKQLTGTLDPLSPSIDHVIPLADPDGPGDVPENRRAAHRLCNIRKGKKALTPELRARLTSADRPTPVELMSVVPSGPQSAVKQEPAGNVA